MANDAVEEFNTLASILVCNAELEAFNSAVVVNEPVSASIRNEPVCDATINELVAEFITKSFELDSKPEGKPEILLNET